MKFRKQRNLLLVCCLICASSVIAQTKSDFHTWATTPPMGWNSWDCFGTQITETQAKEQADYMSANLKKYGWKYFVVDIQWYEQNSKGYEYAKGAKLTMDEFSRLIPAPKKFPSAVNGTGFKALADYVHSKGLKFGIHMMRGIPRQAVRDNTAIKGTNARAADIADIKSVCAWNPDMYGVDMAKPGAQEYYNSLMELVAFWGVDFIKVDDLSRPYHQPEVEAIRKAIERTGREIIFSTSPGETPLSAGPNVNQNANMWRISDDFWDNWKSLLDQFKRLHEWTPYRITGSWPDADMLPLGMLQLGRKTRFTTDEQYTLMSLWSIARSPLIYGGDMTKIDDFTKQMLTNPEVLEVNQQSTNNRQVSRDKNLIVWTADIPNSKDKYVALFNAQSRGDNLDFNNADYASPLIAGKGSSQKVEVSVKGGKKLVLFVKDGGNGFDWDHVVWVDPILHGPKGDLKLTKMKWLSATAGWGEARVNRTCDNKPIIINDKPAEGIGTHGESIIIYELPEGYDTFTATGVVTMNGSVVFGVLVSKAAIVLPETANVKVYFETIGLKGKAKVRDIWNHKDLGTFKGSFSRELSQHGAGLYRISPLH